jgi:hypothetical protein
MNTVANFVKERNEALFSLDRKKIEAYCAKYGDSDSTNVPDLVFWAGVYTVSFKDSAEGVCRGVKKAFQGAHIYITSDNDDDVRTAHRQFFRWKKC